MPTSLDVRDLRKQFATGRPAVDGVSFAQMGTRATSFTTWVTMEMSS